MNVHNYSLLYFTENIKNLNKKGKKDFIQVISTNNV